jgi:hypothetical protein
MKTEFNVAYEQLFENIEEKMEKIYMHQMLVLSKISHAELLNDNEEIFN